MTRRLGLVASTLATFGLALVVALPAAATTTQPDPGDSRATARPGNAVTCAQAGLPGSIVSKDDIDYLESDTHLRIMDVADGFQLTGIVVKGGPAYNVYPGHVWDFLHAPINPGGQIPAISHWFACGVEDGGTTAPTTPTTQPTTGTSSPTTTGSTAPTTSGSESTTSESSGATNPTSSSEVGGGTGPGAGEDEEEGLADTGVSTNGLLIGGSALLLVGAGLILAVRRTRRQAQE
ncbi:MAG TPA: hypothetical protein VFM37_14665 [Pseudonocardiaceae bacterium]|nr:hypothetical protein [Pseudonocardiaceae bacterium]